MDTELSYEVRPQFNGAARKGFYSKGGFVDLRDLELNSSTIEEATERNAIIPETVHTLIEAYRDDADFRVENVETGKTFNDLPSYPYFSKRTYRRRIMLSWLVTIGFALIMISFTFLPTYFNDQISHLFFRYTWGTSVPGIMTGALIFLGENIWMMVYPILTKWENHRTNQSHIDSLIIKRFSFEYVVSMLNRIGKSLSSNIRKRF